MVSSFSVSAGSPGSTPESDPTSFPATPGQEQIWLAQHLLPDSSAYHEPLTVRVRGPLDVEAMRRSLQAVVTRHEALRTVFRRPQGAQGALTQQVLADVPQFSIYDLETMEPRERAERLAAIRSEQVAQPFDLANGPLIRFVLVILDLDEYELIVVVHRIVADEKAVDVFAGEVLDCYAEFSQRRRPALDPPPFRFADHVAERARAEADVDLAHWREELAALDDPLELPFARPRGEVQDRDASVLPFTLPEPVTAGLRALAGQEGCSPFTAMLAVFAVLLHRYTGSTDIVLGTETGGREAPGADRVIGAFAGPQVLRVRLPYDPTWREVVRLVAGVSAETARHRDASFAQVVSAVHPPRHPDLHPIFQMMMTPPPVAGDRRTVAGVTFSVEHGDSGQARYDLELRADEGGGYLKAADALLDREHAQVVLEHYLALLARMVTEPDHHLSGHSLLDEGQEQRILRDWNDTRTDYPRDQTLPDLFAAWVQKTPEAPALTWEDFSVTYAELEERSNQLAHHLIRLGVGLETGVGLYFGYTADWVIAALATLKAGGYYVPLDPAYPHDRLVAMCEDADVKVLLMHAGAAAGPTSTEAIGLFLDRDAEAVRAEPTSRPEIELDPDHLAYIMFTSGSTGRAKAIGVTHRNVVRTVCDTPYVEFLTTDRVGQASNISFDAATFEVWGALLHGAELIGLRKEAVLDPERLHAELRSKKINTFFLPAALMKQIVAERPDTFGTLTYFFSGGEQADLHTHRRMLRYGPPKNMYNPYGPTETTVFAIVYRTNDMPDDETYVPIGTPIGNTTSYVLDGYLQPVPVGVMGELFVGGDGVARGYVGQPHLTAETFIPDPFSGEPGARLYRTGDLARYRPDGLIDFLGRIDRQVKIRGFRVEPAEIETCLLGSGLVREVSVQVGSDRSGDQVLIAYATPAGEEIDTEELRAYARAQLPAYMVPGVFVTMSAFPLNANGKLDVRALVGATPVDTDEPEAGGPDSGTTDTEMLLLDLWREALGNGDLRVTDNVFSAGADSLTAARVVWAAGEAVGAQLPYRLPFEHQSVTTMAAVVDTLRPAAPMVQSPASGDLPAADAGHVPDAAENDRVERLLAIWRDVLEMPSLGPDDDFFLNGGHSLKVTRVKSRVRMTFGVDVPVSLLFENRTVRTFATAMEGLGASEEQPIELGSQAKGGGEDIDDLLAEIERLAGDDLDGPPQPGS